MQIGLENEEKIIVTEDMLAAAAGSGFVNVYATPMMIAHIEGTAAHSVQPLLPEGKTTVGVAVEIEHLAATPCGMQVRLCTELVEISANGKILTFAVSAFDEKEQIGRGLHRRAIVDRAKFEQRAAGKGQK